MEKRSTEETLAALERSLADLEQSDVSEEVLAPLRQQAAALRQQLGPGQPGAPVGPQAAARGVAVGGNVVGSAIVTGDRNVVQQGKYNVHISSHADDEAIRRAVRESLGRTPPDEAGLQALESDYLARECAYLETEGVAGPPFPSRMSL